MLLEGHGWRAGKVVSADAVAIEGGEVVPVARVKAIVHQPRGEQAPPPHEAPDLLEMGYLVLLGTIFFETKRAELECAAWPEWKDPVAIAARRAGSRRMSVATASTALAVTATEGSLTLAATAVSEG